MPFAEFTRKRIFEPLGMTRTSWRDDYHAHRQGPRDRLRGESSGATARDMPFENVHGNGGLLTTVGDLLRVERELRGTAASAARRCSHERCRRRAGSAGGRRARLRVSAWRSGDYKGVREIPPQRHDRGLSRVPGALSGPAGVRRRAVQCRRQHAAARRCTPSRIFILADAFKPEPDRGRRECPLPSSTRSRGLYRNIDRGDVRPDRARRQAACASGDGTALDSALVHCGSTDREGTAIEFDGPAAARWTTASGTLDRLERVRRLRHRRHRARSARRQLRERRRGSGLRRARAGRQRSKSRSGARDACSR